MRSITVASVALGLLIACCGGDTQKWYGKWEGDLQRADPSAPNDDVRHTIDLLRIEILPNGTFEMLEGGIPKSGTHNLGSDRAFLTVTKIFGEPIEPGSPTDKVNQDMTLVWQEDGTVLWRDPAGHDAVPVKLERASQP